MMKYIAQLEKYVYKMESIETDVDETDDKDIDFVEIGNNVYLNKKTNKTYEIADDFTIDDLNEDLF